MIAAFGTVYLAKTRPLARRAADGVFTLTLLAFDRLGPHQVEPWRITYSGIGAQMFWAAYECDLQPGRPIDICVNHLRTFTNGRGGASEVHAQVTRIALPPQPVPTPLHQVHLCPQSP